MSDHKRNLDFSAFSPLPGSVGPSGMHLLLFTPHAHQRALVQKIRPELERVASQHTDGPQR